MRRSPPLRGVALIVLALAASAAVLRAHDMFWRLTSYVVEAGRPMRLPVLNGTFSKSENSIEWARVADLSVVSPDGRAHPDSTLWDTKGDTSWLSLTPQREGIWMAGLSTKPRELAQEAKAFNDYLRDDGIPDVLAARKRDGALGKKARERYSKHIKTIFRVGATHNESWNTVLGYPAELVPLSDPSAARPGTSVRFRCLVDGAPVPNQLVMVGGRAGSQGDRRLPPLSLRSDAEGIVTVPLAVAGRWYVKFIRMVPVADGVVDYESKWATLTFEIRSK